MKLKLYHYWRSSSSWRVRWAFELKKIEAEKVAVNLLDDETDQPEHRARNPMGYVPVLEFLDSPVKQDSLSARHFLTESMAILEWTEERFPSPSLLPGTPEERAHIRRLAELVNSGIQPLQNPPVMGAVSKDDEERKKWCQRWIRNGFSAYSEWIRGSSGLFSVGNQITLADLFLIPQCYSALRFEVDLEKEFPALAKIYSNALKTDSCQASHPDRYQPRSQ
jgi:maleylacetoacetate isomerase